MTKIKLKNILNEIAFESDRPQVDKKEVIEAVSQYSAIGKQLYSKHSIVEIAEQLVKVADSAYEHVISETDDWFDKISVDRNMKSLKKNVQEFKKTAIEAKSVNEWLVDLYENIGFTLGKYYDIKSVNEESGDKEEYQAFFRKACKKFGIKPDDIDTISDEKKKELFSWVEKNWKKDTN